MVCITDGGLDTCGAFLYYNLYRDLICVDGIMLIWIMWFIAALASLIAEAIHPGLFIFLPLSAGCVAAALAAMVGFSMIWQMILMAIMFIVSIFICYILSGRGKRYPRTNVYALIGRHGYVIEPIYPYQKGYVMLGGEKWLARADTYIPEGVLVVVTDVSGGHVVVQQSS